MKQLVLVAMVVLLNRGASASAEPEQQPDLRAFTSDGRQVLLKSDNTWEFIQASSGDPATSAVLTVTRVDEMQEACKLQLRLQNNLGYRISSLVPRLAVRNQDGVVYDSKSVSFTSIRPTDAKYTDIQFSGIGCHQISIIDVFDASHCRMGDIDQWNEEDDQCLSNIYVEPSDLINISKKPTLN